MSKRRNGVRASVRATGPAAPTVPRAGSAPPPVPADRTCRAERGSGFHDDHLHTADGRIFSPADRGITPARAQELLQDGAVMVVDDCGGNGCCGLEWPDDTERAVLARRPPSLTRRRYGWLEEWHDPDGRPLLLQCGDVRWP